MSSFSSTNGLRIVQIALLPLAIWACHPAGKVGETATLLDTEDAASEVGIASLQAFASCADERLSSGIRTIAYATEIYRRCSATLDRIDWVVGEDARRMVAATVIGNRWAPYGPNTATTAEDLEASLELDCDNYAVLTALIYRALNGGGTVRFLGFHGGAVGNHAQISLHTGATDILADPTVGLVAILDVDALLSGKRPSAMGTTIQTSRNMKQFGEVVLSAVRDGKYRPTELLYYFDNLPSYVDLPRFFGPSLV